MPDPLSPSMRQKLIEFALLLVDQGRASIIVPPQQNAPGFWFGGGNMISDDAGNLWVVGRFRNHGDSRTGVGSGERGLELAIFRSKDRGSTFEKLVSLSKADLNCGEHDVLSIEGTALRQSASGIELYVSTEKSGIEYPDRLTSFLKPGTGVWTIDRLVADSILGLSDSEVDAFLACSDPRWIHVKDPFVSVDHDQTRLLFCSHPFCWTSSNTGYIDIDDVGSASAEPNFDFFRRGFAWDVAISRGTAVVPVPKIGAFSEHDLSLMFYDGGECVRDLTAHQAAVERPRGYSCEEIGGLAYYRDGNLRTIDRLSVTKPLFVSPHGTGCSRYVDVLVTDDGYYATWQQSQADGSQPLVMNYVSHEAVRTILSR